ncbi:hypothetical protein K488DRAFT_70269 [Vararia minispora EC-137]|uniref:Uncharacterized protein n=1 Tax=Vararia minispora EC-137 TaxID=1314806 RepID=A0ACB8QMH1_9AGAM|nr:hypothetical protein K488DRAFT_70269 [Vararia minispora EC-137]
MTPRPFDTFEKDPPSPLIWGSLVPFGPYTEVLNSANVSTSRLHSELFLAREHEGVIEIVDKSTNGTLVNGQRIEPREPHVLSNMDVVTFGPPEIEDPTQFRFGLGNRPPRHYRYIFYDFSTCYVFQSPPPGLTPQQIDFRMCFWEHDRSRRHAQMMKDCL